MGSQDASSSAGLESQKMTEGIMGKWSSQCDEVGGNPKGAENTGRTGNEGTKLQFQCLGNRGRRIAISLGPAWST